MLTEDAVAKHLGDFSKVQREIKKGKWGESVRVVVAADTNV